MARFRAKVVCIGDPSFELIRMKPTAAEQANRGYAHSEVRMWQVADGPLRMRLMHLPT